MLVFDCETNGLLPNVSQIHCLAIYDTDTKESHVFNDIPSDKHGIIEGIVDRLIKTGLFKFDEIAVHVAERGHCRETSGIKKCKRLAIGNFYI